MFISPMRDFGSISPYTTRSPEQAEKERKQIRKSAEEMLKDPEAVRAFLLKHGFITKGNKLSRRYR